MENTRNITRIIFLFEVVALLLLNFELGSYGVWGLRGESFYYVAFCTLGGRISLASALPPKFNFINSFNFPRWEIHASQY